MKEPEGTMRQYPQIAQRSLKQRELQRYQPAWDCLSDRFRDEGAVTIPDAADALVDMLGVTKGTAYDILNRHKGDIFWSISKNRFGVKKVWLNSPATVCKKLGIERLLKSISVPEYCFKNLSTSQRRAVLYKHSLCDNWPEHEYPVSREKIRERTGRVRQTQWKYEKSAGIEKQYNYAKVLDISGKETKEELAKRTLKATNQEGANGKYKKMSLNGEKGIYRQLPNTYRDPAFSFASLKALRRVNAKLSGQAGVSQSELRLHPYRRKETKKMDLDTFIFKSEKKSNVKIKVDKNFDVQIEVENIKIGVWKARICSFI